jgi:hypothetical protein
MGDAVQISTGDVHAYLVTPCSGTDCEDGAEGTTAAWSLTSDRPKIALPENVRNLLRQQLARRYHIPDQSAHRRI